MFGKVQLSPSSYDTAWVAMVPSRGALKEPLFPESVDWIMQNQHPNGSWGLNPSHPLLVKDSLSSTLACLLALQKWKLGEQLVQKGLDFIGSNHFYVNDKQQPSPIGFDIVFPGMVSKAIELGLNLPLDAALVDIMLSNAEHKVKRSWQQRNVEIFLDVTCCASAFRLLRMRGYEVGSGVPISIMGSILHWRWKILTAAKPYTAKNFSYLRSIDSNVYLFRAFHQISLLIGHNACITRWVKDTRIDQLGLDWHVLYSSHFVVASVHFSPELADARMAWSEISIIGTILDDMFDIDGTRQELLNIIELVEKIEYIEFIEFTSHWKITGINVQVQNLEMIKCMLKEVDWWTENLAPGIDEYIFNGTATVGCGIFSTIHFFLGPELAENVLSSQEYANLYYYVGRVVRPLNDYRSDERERVERKLNLCSLLVNQSNGTLAEEDAKDEVRNIIESSRREVLRMMLQTYGSLVPKAVKESVWEAKQVVPLSVCKGR
ncbi:hypothetical protein RJ639_043248 [Escallonia herrerae]|uniref:Terpene synthase metal-binding domain-containing protein n=1 Tax=Escallonia herrerae TaxID=1293975 RepID=A0AA88WDV1_9ASTE|nr:hypothetical protein RJ639_043248 [Escallonia herrerae]